MLFSIIIIILFSFLFFFLINLMELVFVIDDFMWCKLLMMVFFIF